MLNYENQNDLASLRCKPQEEVNDKDEREEIEDVFDVEDATTPSPNTPSHSVVAVMMAAAKRDSDEASVLVSDLVKLGYLAIIVLNL